MADDSQADLMETEWTDFVGQMNEQLFETMEASAQAQAEFVEALFEGAESMDGDQFSDGMGYSQAYEVWMEAAEESVEMAASDASSGEISPNEFRDLWLDAANDAFKEVVSTEAFASIAGKATQEALELRQTADETRQGTLRELGFATERDVREIGERLAELERRQNDVEQELDRLDAVEDKLDRILDRLETEK